MRRFESKIEQTGGIFEEDYIGKVNTQNPEYQKSLKKVQGEEEKAGMENGYIRFRKAVELVKESQPYDPTNPNKPFARDIRISLADLLIGKSWIKETEEDQNRIKFYTAVGTPLDIFHSADAFIEYEDTNGKIYRVTLDLSINPNKKGYKDNVIISDLPAPDIKEEKLKYLKSIEEYATKILEKIEEQKRLEELNK